ncbi:TMEM175 family protein [Deinococcus sp.]|uniref:TMEM175 family protein n=1 Tax=Deinococcus sp. TaxID=47478 RepID=UPI003C7A2B11
MVSFFKGPNRLEAFSDGVFAIALTLLVLEIKAPNIGEHGSSAALWAGLAHLWPSYVAYLLAFMTVLVSWIGHHIIIGQVKRVDPVLLVANGFFLLTVSFLPFPTSIVAEHLRGESGSAAAAVYALANLLNSAAFLGLVRAVVHLNPEATGPLAASGRNALLGLPWCLFCAGVAFWSPVASLLLVAAMWVWWMRPGQEWQAGAARPGPPG